MPGEDLDELKPPQDDKAAAQDRTAPANLATARRNRLVQKLYADHWDDLVGWLTRRYGPGPPEPEEIAQGAFARLAALDRVDHIRNPKAFLFTTAVNAMLMSVRWLGRTKRLIDGELKNIGEDVEEMTPERIYSMRQHLERVLDGVKTLTPKQREILLRSRQMGQTYEEISAETGWSSADISRQMKAALAQLRKLISEDPNADNEGRDR